MEGSNFESTVEHDSIKYKIDKKQNEVLDSKRQQW